FRGPVPFLFAKEEAMFIRLGYDLQFDVPSPAAMLLILFVHPSRAAGLRRPDRVRAEPAVPVQEVTDPFGNRCGPVLAPAGTPRLSNDTVIEASGAPDPPVPAAGQHPVEELPPETLPYLMPSRYCEVDELGDAAWELFGNTPLGWARVQAVCDWVHANVRF